MAGERLQLQVILDTIDKTSPALKKIITNSKQQAEAVAAAVRDWTEAADLVTRKDLQIELAPIRADIALLRQELIQLEQRMTIKLGSMMVVAVAVVAALVKLL